MSFPLAIALLVLFVAGSALAAPFTLIYYDGHMHTWRQDGTGDVDDIKATAKSRGLSAVIITDHCEGLDKKKWASLIEDCEEATDDTFLALPAFEVTGSDGIFNRTHVNALNVGDPFVGRNSDCLCPEEVWESPPNPDGTGALRPENVKEWVDYIHSQGGIAVHNHPSGSTKLEYGVDNIEVYNQGHVDDVISYARELDYSDAEAWGFAITMNNFAVYGERDLSMTVPWPFPPYSLPLKYALYYATAYFEPYVGQWLGSPQAPLKSWDQLLMAYVNGAVDKPIFGLANSDAHNTGDPDSKVGLAKNGAYVKNLTAKELFNAIKNGRTFATTEPSLDFKVDGKLMGETTYVSDDAASIYLSVNSENPTAILVKIDIIKNGVILDTIAPFAATFEDTLGDTVTEDGYYRIEITSYNVITGGYQFAWSNPVFVRILEP